MNKYTSGIVVGCIISIVPGCFFDSGKIINGKFVSTRYNYEFSSLSSDWSCEIKEGLPDIVCIHRRADAEIRVTTIHLEPDLAEREPEAFATSAASALKYARLIDDVNVKGILRGNEKVAEVLYTGLYKGKDVILKSSQYWYVLRYLAAPMYYDQYLPDFEKVVNSFHVTSK